MKCVLRKLTGLSKVGQILTDSLGIHGGHTDRIFSVRGQLGEQDGGFLPTNLGLVGKESQFQFLSDKQVARTTRLMIRINANEGQCPLWHHKGLSSEVACPCTDILNCSRQKELRMDFSHFSRIL